jgi:FkbM family methyltransferase
MNIINDISKIPSGKTVLYGAGTAGVDILALLRSERKDIDVCAFLDDGKSGVMCGLDVIPPENRPSDAQILVTSAYYHLICDKLEAAGIDYILLHPMLLYPDMIFSPERYEQSKDDIQRASELFADKGHKQMYQKLISCRYDIDSIREIAPSREGAMEYLEHTANLDIKVILEGGVYDGRNSLEFVENFGKDTMVYGFEPQAEVFNQSEYGAQLSRINFELIPAGLFASDGEVSFCTDELNMLGSKIGDKGENTIDVRSIDSFVKERSLEKVDMIKLDIEGAEMHVLRGALETIKSHRPVLCIAIYHSCEDMVQIPLFIKDSYSDCEYYLGHYSKTYWDTVLYVVPKEML